MNRKTADGAVRDPRREHSQQSYFKADDIEMRSDDQGRAADINSPEFDRVYERKVKDSIYNEFICFRRDIWKYIDNPVYTRLKQLYQLGSLYYVFPGATHTRFAHSLGVGHLAQKQMRYLYDIRGKDSAGLSQGFQQYRITEEDIKNVTMAGLMHDLGHGPFSH